MRNRPSTAAHLGRRARAVRLVATSVVIAALLSGTFWGDDDHFPLGPFRMYSVANRLDGEIRVVTFSATTADGERVDLRPERLGLRPAEVEGQMERLVDEPEALGDLVKAYERLGGEAELHELRLIEQAHQLEGGRPVSTERSVLATWRRS